METLLLLSLGLRSVLVEKLERLGGGVSVEGVGELGDGRRHLEAQVQDLLLALKTDILWPPINDFLAYATQHPQFVGDLLHHARQVALGLDILTNAEVSGSLLEEGVLVTVSLGQITVAKEGLDLPWPLSCWYRPSLEGRARARASFLWVAVIEKRKIISTCSMIISFDSTEKTTR